MYLKKLTLKNYRNIENAEIEFAKGTNLIAGDNAQGKTNILEAIYIFARGRSFRGTPDRELIRNGEEFFTVKNFFTDKERENELFIEYTEKKMKRYVNGVKTERNVDMLSRFRAVLFCPDHLFIVKGSPAERREFLNIAIAQTDREYIYLLGGYGAALNNRNALLKKVSEAGLLTFDKNRIKEQISIWDAQLARYASRIASRRQKYTESVSPYAEFFASEMSGGNEKLRLFYSCDIEDPSDEEGGEARYLSIFEKSLERDIICGATQHGVHRDDLTIKLNGAPIKTTGSQGQQRTAVLAMKLAEGEICREKTGEYPVFLFDDVLSELDANRRKYIIKRSENKQFFITSCEPDSGEKEKAEKIFKVFAGACVLCGKDDV